MKTRKLVFGDQIVEISLSDDTSEAHWEYVLSTYIQPEITLQELKDEIIAKIYTHAKTLYSDLISDYSLAEAASWTKKEQESRAYLESGISTVSLKAEALSRYNNLPEHKAMAKLATIVVTKANYLHQQNSKIAGARGRHIDAIALIQSKQEVENYNWIEGW